MTTPFLGEIRLIGFNYAPRGWAFCWGQLLSIAQNSAVFSLLGTTYGGNGSTTFALPDLRGRIPIGLGQGPGLPPVTIGETGGSETVSLLATQIPAHSHSVYGAVNGTRSSNPGGNLLASGEMDLYNRDTTGAVELSAAAVASNGGGQPHNNLQPFLCMNFVIALEGVFPSRN